MGSRVTTNLIFTALGISIASTVHCSLEARSMEMGSEILPLYSWSLFILEAV